MRRRLKPILKGSVFFRAFNALPPEDRPKMLAVGVVQVLLGFLDLAGVAAVGVLGALAVTGIQSKEPSDNINSLLSMAGLSHLSFQAQIAIIGFLAGLFLIIRTILSVVLTRRILFFLSHKGATISATLTNKLLSRDLLAVQSRSTQETLFAVTSGVEGLTLGILGNSMSLLSDGSLLLILFVGLFVISPYMAVGSGIFFGALSFFLYIRLNKRAQKLGAENSRLTINSNRQIIEVLESYREAVVHNRRAFYAGQIERSRHDIADTTALLKFMPNIGKYVIETGLIVGAILVSGIQFISLDASHAVAALAIFLASGSRIAPAVLRIQNGTIGYRQSVGSASTTLELMDSLKEVSLTIPSRNPIDHSYGGFVGEINLNGVCLRYPGSKTLALKNVSLTILPGESVAIVGPSGAGKTTLVDVLLGVLNPDSGQVLISSKPPLKTFSEWPGSVSYVPQNVTVSNGTISENVSLGYLREEGDDERIWSALEVAQLSTFVSQLSEGLNTQVGERGSMISGGQRQRLGIARAMFTKPKVLVLDEATSSLDGQSEYDISQALKNLHGSVTVIMIAHRLSSVQHVDKVVYMEDGEIKAIGSFASIREAVPNFNAQVSLLGF